MNYIGIKEGKKPYNSQQWKNLKQDKLTFYIILKPSKLTAWISSFNL